VIGVTANVSTESSPTSTMTLQRTYSKAILCFVYGRPELEESVLKRVKEIIDFTMKYKSLSQADSNNAPEQEVI
jgi:hypothetical protein